MPESCQTAPDRAEAHFQEHYNCAQSVLWGVAETCGLACPSCIPAVALAMGGGIGHTGRACGALTGAVMAIGLAVDRAVDGSISDRKDEANRLAAALVHRFADEFGTTDCAAILGFSWEDPGALERYYRENAKDTKCMPCIRWAAAEAVRIIDDLDAGTPASDEGR
ncbi:MAG TPA: C-GCAxxG-C-C family protein [Phycisphaerae bacterium]|nr:C-GCAxxG-C-C family protein [Phycisphaerae bacterium]